MLNATSNWNSKQTDMVCNAAFCGEPQLRSHTILTTDDYEITLPAWLKECVEKIPPGIGISCPRDSEALIVAAFDLAFQLHEGQFRASGEPYIIHPVAVADLLMEI